MVAEEETCPEREGQRWSRLAALWRSAKRPLPATAAYPRDNYRMQYMCRRFRDALFARTFQQYVPTWLPWHHISGNADVEECFAALFASALKEPGGKICGWVDDVGMAVLARRVPSVMVAKNYFGWRDARVVDVSVRFDAFLAVNNSRQKARALLDVTANDDRDAVAAHLSSVDRTLELLFDLPTSCGEEFMGDVERCFRSQAPLLFDNASLVVWDVLRECFIRRAQWDARRAWVTACV